MSKKILSLILSPISVLPVVVASATVNRPDDEKNQTKPQDPNNQTQTPPAKPEDKKDKPKEISPAFSDFKELANKEIELAVSNVIKEGKKILQALHDTAKKEENPKDFKANLRKIIYLKELIKYLSKEDNIKKNRFDNGLPLIFPKVIGENKDLITSEADFNKNVYNNFWTGKEDYTDYKEAITGAGNKINFSEKNKKFITDTKGTIKTDAKKSEKNVFTKEEFTKLIKKYSSDLLKESRKLFYDEKDIPEFELNYDNLENLTWGNPKNFASWSDYIFTKLYPRILDFDLKQNQQAVQEKNQQQNKKNPVNPPNIPPLVPGKPNNKPIFDDSTELEKAIPSLPPFVSPEYAIRSSSQLSSLFRSAKEEDKQKIFFFNNPINTRYEYKVVSFDSGASDEIKNIKIYISDRVVKNLSRSYTIETTKLLTLSESTLKKAEVESLSKIFQGVSRSVGYDEKLDYGQINNATLQLAMFNMVKAANERILNNESPSFRESQDKLQNSYLNLWKEGNDNGDLVESYKYLTELNFLGELSATKIDKGIFWAHLADAYVEVLEDLKTVIEGNKKIIEENIDEIKGDKILINQLFNMSRQESFKFKSLSNQIPIDRSKWYKSYISLSTSIKNNISLLSSLIDRELIKGKEENKKKYLENYNKAQEVINLNQQQKNGVKNIISYVIVAIGVLIVAINTVALIMKRKNLKNKQILALIIIIYLCSLVLIGAGIALLLI
ncbi:hypothetical protein DA803_00270 [[Mycoplasma] phocae]|uniref:Transmembrane protein n=1 Tax=[Mycoplasma] phocae TaxID=142651 RepID=A0A2Z5IPU6_9BACT|nr:hypothetical protein [[Mycoplasma] phocae]AXE60537.1 hypothetical protein DA803_00270 [[Mycoplasma] phocae]